MEPNAPRERHRACGLALWGPTSEPRASFGSDDCRFAPSGVIAGSRPFGGSTIIDVWRWGLPYSRQCARDSPKNASFAFANPLVWDRASQTPRR